MRSIVFNITTLLYKLRYLFTKSFKIKGKIFNSKFIFKKNNIIEINREFSNSQIYIDGYANIIKSNGLVQHTNIKIIGNNNIVCFENQCKIQRSQITIRADNASFVIGENSDILSGIFICQGNSNYIHIGKDCLFSANVELWNSDTHTIYDKDEQIINQSKPIVIGDHVWLGKFVKVLKGVTIGDDSIVGMSSLVTKNIPSNTINAGMPCKIIKEGVYWDKRLIME